MGSVEATNVILSVIALASVAQVALLAGLAVMSARSLRSIRERVDEASGRLERMAGPVLARAEHAMDEVGRAAEAVQDVKHSADLAVESARQATGHVVHAVSGPVYSVIAAAAGIALGVLRQRRHRRARRMPVSVH